MHMYNSHSYLYDTGLRGMPVRCEERDGIVGSHGLSPSITQQSGLVLIFRRKHGVRNDAENSRLPTRLHKLIPVHWSVLTLLLL